MSPLLLGGSVIAAVLLTTKKSSYKSDADADIDALTQMLLTETDFSHTPDEMAQVVYVALNRMQRKKTNAYSVVYDKSWNGSADYAKRFNRMPSHAKWSEARDFVAKLYLGRGPTNRGFNSFIHPTGMRQPPCADNRVSVWTFAGYRCFPAWAVNETRIGVTLFYTA